MFVIYLVRSNRNVVGCTLVIGVEMSALLCLGPSRRVPVCRVVPIASFVLRGRSGDYENWLVEILDVVVF